jgi:glycerophosphoryl diester phosphodiesterase
MKIISHRGYWKEVREKNTPEAFSRSFSLGFGTETDFRDRDGELVIAHDLPGRDSLPAEDFFRIFAQHDRRLLLAVNIKADGLQGLLKAAFERHGVKNYFLFDMSVPDAIFSLKQELRVFTRHSDVEPQPAFYAQATGIWMDAFYDDTWLTPAAIAAHLQAGKQVCLVSPELHKRPHLAFWTRLKSHPIAADSRLILCTDLPEEATAFFHP